MKIVIVDTRCYDEDKRDYSIYVKHAIMHEKEVVEDVTVVPVMFFTTRKNPNKKFIDKVYGLLENFIEDHHFSSLGYNTEVADETLYIDILRKEIMEVKEPQSMEDLEYLDKVLHDCFRPFEDSIIKNKSVVIISKDLKPRLKVEKKKVSDQDYGQGGY